MDFPLTVDLSTAGIRLKPGGMADVVVTIRNVSPIVQHYEARVIGLPSEDLWSRDVETVKLRPGESGTITVKITLPQDTQVLGGTYVLGVLVRSPYQPNDVSRAEELTLVVETVAGITMSAFPEIIQGRNDGFFSVTVANTGNTAVSLDLVATDDQGKASFFLNPPGVALPARGTQPVQVQIRSRGPFSGNERRSAVTVRAMAGGEQRGETRVTFVQQPRVASAVLRVLGIVLAVAVVAASIIVGGILGRSDDTVTPTQQATTQQPTTVTTSASGDKPPAAPKIKITPPQPIVNENVNFSAQVPDGVTEFAWQVIKKPEGTVMITNVNPQFDWTPAEVGDYNVKLTISDDGGESSTAVDFSVQDRPSNVQIVSEEVELPNNELVTHTVDCPEPKVALGGGAYVALNEAQGLLFESSRPIDGGKGWSVAIRNTGEDTTAVVSANCIQPFDGLKLRPFVEEEPSDVRRSFPGACEPGEVSLGGGGGVQRVDDQEPRAVIDESRPVKDGSDSWWMLVVDMSSPRLLETLVWCAPPPAGFAIEVTSVDAPVGSGLFEETATCATGQALGGGVGFAEGAVQVDPDRSIIMRSSGPASVKPGEMGQGWVGSGEFNVQLDQKVGVYAICAQLD